MILLSMLPMFCVQFWAINLEKQRTLATQRRLPYQVCACCLQYKASDQLSSCDPGCILGFAVAG